MISPVKIWRRQGDIRSTLGKRGVIITWTKILVAGTDFKSFAPYYVAVAQLENGQRISAPLVNINDNEIKIGAKVKATLRKVRQTTQDDVIAYGIKFRLL